jgi:dTMP kinase
MKKFIAIEGLDGVGKSTQIDLLLKYFKRNNLKYKYLHFPRLEIGCFGKLISKFLRGEFGKLEIVDPYLVSLIYAGDRKDAKITIKEWLVNEYFVIVDRYVYSNIAFQCAKIMDVDKKEELKKWILDFEYIYNRIPKPDLSIYLNVPFTFVKKALKNDRSGLDREYLKGKKDIHESSLELQKNVEFEYQSLGRSQKDFYIIDCHDRNGLILSPNSIHKKIIKQLKDLDIIE